MGGAGRIWQRSSRASMRSKPKSPSLQELAAGIGDLERKSPSPALDEKTSGALVEYLYAVPQADRTRVRVDVRVGADKLSG